MPYMASFKDLLKKAADSWKNKPSNQLWNKFANNTPQWGNKLAEASTRLSSKLAEKRVSPWISPVASKLPEIVEGAGGFLGRQIIQPALDIPKNVNIARDKTKPKLERVLAGAQAVGGAIPGVDDAAIMAIMAAQNKLAGKSFTKGFTGEEFTGTGTLLAKDTKLETPLNITGLGIPLLMGKIKPKQVDEVIGVVKRVDPPNMNTILKKIDKGEQAIRQGGWGTNKFSPEELDGIKRAVDDFRAQIGKGPTKVKNYLGKLPANSSQVKKAVTTAAQDLDEATMKAEQAKIMRSMFSSESIKDVAQLKFLGSKILANGGDIESVRAKYPKLVERITQAVREAEPNIKYDEEAFQYALDLPVKAATSTPKPTELNKLKKSLEPIENLKQQGLDVVTGETGKPIAVSAEPTVKTMKEILSKGQKAGAKADEFDYKAWEKAVFRDAKAKGGISNPLDVLTKSVKKETNAAASGLDFADDWKGKSRISLARETMVRNFEDIMGKDAPMMKTKYLEPIASKEAERLRWLNKERADIKALGIEPRSKDSWLLQDFGEGKINEVELRSKTDNFEKIINAERVLRQKYDSYLQQLNKVLVRNGYDPVPYRKDYFHHFNDLLTSFDILGPWQKIGQALKTEELPTDINGLSADFKPGRQFFSAVFQRQGDKATPDAIQGIDKYLEGASNQIFHTDNIKRIRSLEDEIRTKYVGKEHLTDLAAELREYGNTLAGKKAMMDRAVESVVGRQAYAVANALRSQVGANMVGANVASAITNYIPLTQTIATTDKMSVLKAMYDTMANTLKSDGFTDLSDFIVRRRGSDALTMTKWQQAGKKAGWLFDAVDSFTSQVVTRSKYLEGLKQGLSESDAMKRANDWASRVMGDRSKGATPSLFNSKTLGFVTQFQLEVNNQLSFLLKDIPRNSPTWQKAASQMGQLFLYGYLFNNFFESLTGRRPALDPIGVAQRAYEDYNNENISKGKATLNLTENIANQLPFTSLFSGGRLPYEAAIPKPGDVLSGKSTWQKEILKPVTYLLPPFGGGQARKTIEGILAYNKGASTSPSGAVRYSIPQTPENLFKTTLFGQWSTDEAQKYLREGQNVLGEKQTEQYLKLQKINPELADTYYQNVIKQRQLKDIKNEIKQDKKSWLESMFGKRPAQASDTSISDDPLDQLVIAEKQRQEKRNLINDIMYGKDYEGLPEDQKQSLLVENGITQSDLDEARLASMRSLSASDRATYIIGQTDPDLNMLYKNDVLTPEVAKELERKGYINSADDLIDKLKLTDPYYIRKEQLKSMEKMLKTQADTQKKLIKANYQGMAKMLQTVSKPRRKSSMRKTLRVQKVKDIKVPKPTAYKVRPL